jgi:alpha-beta hydrolase superfamily lysophospholipase
MKTLILIISTLVLTSWVSSSSSKENAKDPSFSYKELESAEKVPIPPLQYIEASDKTRLAYREYTPKQISAVLIFYHGGGTYSAGGYQYIGNGLSNRFNILVITPDIRGHGDSGGEEGDAPSPEQVFDDIGVFIRHMKAKYPQKPVFLGGHSSGGGTILNYSNFNKREKVRGYVFISPHLGFRSKTEIENPANPFATVKIDLFVKNAMFGTHGNSKAVFFNYSKEVLQKTKNIAAITVNMSNAQTPASPKEQLQELNLPAAVWIGKEDEVLDAIKVISFFKENNPKSFTKIVEGEKHLSILLAVSNHIGPWIHDVVR